MALSSPFHLQQWIDDHRHLLKPPVGNQQVYKDNQDFIVMVVGGPNARKDYHLNQTEELFYQLEGTITLKVVDEGEFKDVEIGPGEMFLLPPNVPHSPRRPADTVGLVVERHRAEGMQDGFRWYCENCHNALHEEFLPVKDIVGQLPVVMGRFMESEALRTCNKCGTVMEKVG